MVLGKELFCCSGHDQVSHLSFYHRIFVCFIAAGERVWIQDLSADHDKRNLEEAALHFNLKRENDLPDVKLQLKENTRLNQNAPVYESVMMANDKQRLVKKSNIPLIVRKNIGSTMRLIMSANVEFLS